MPPTTLDTRNIHPPPPPQKNRLHKVLFFSYDQQEKIHSPPHTCQYVLWIKLQQSEGTWPGGSWMAIPQGSQRRSLWCYLSSTAEENEEPSIHIMSKNRSREGRRWKGPEVQVCSCVWSWMHQATVVRPRACGLGGIALWRRMKPLCGLDLPWSNLHLKSILWLWCGEQTPGDEGEGWKN